MTDPRRPARPAKPRGQPAPKTRDHEAGKPERARMRVRPERYLVASVLPQQMPAGSPPIDGAGLITELDQDPEIRVIRTIKPVQRPTSGFPPIAVVEMTADHAAALAGMHGVHIEIDHWLGYGDLGLPIADPGLTTLVESLPVAVSLVDDDERPLPGATVHLLGEHFHVSGVAGEDGTLQLPTPADEIERVRGVLVRPRQDCWAAWLARPVLSAGEPNRFTCRRLDAAARGGWSRRAMGFDRLPPNYLGHGVRLAVIDSGATLALGDLADHVADGLDVLGQDDKSWREDLLGPGSHAVGLIAATDEQAQLVGLAPEVDLHVCKVMPGGRYSDLIEALDYCLTRDIDVVHLGVGSPYPSWLVAQKIEQARQAGIACVAGAGNGAAAAMFPASLPTVLAVGAVGKLGTFPADSYHITHLRDVLAADGSFLARFSATGPEVDVYAPGVAVVSTVPAGSVGAADGTGVAAAHIAALAALVLAHHPDFHDGFRVRGAARVDRLLQIIRASGRQLPLGDPRWMAARVPDAVTAVGLAPMASTQFALDTLWSAMTAAGPPPPGTAIGPSGSHPATMFGPAAGFGPTIGYAYSGPGPSSRGPMTVAPSDADATLGQLRSAMRAAGLAMPPPTGTPADSLSAHE